MPIYEYRCEACGHGLDALQKLSDEPLRECPQCGKPRLRRLVSAPAFRLKGGGWYETDFKSDKEKKRNLADEGKNAATNKPGEPKDKDSKKNDKTEPSAPKKQSDAGTPSSGSGTAVA
jgi:putative FmdB family regulatory protein